MPEAVEGDLVATWDLDKLFARNRALPAEDNLIAVLFCWWERNRDEFDDYRAKEFASMVGVLFATIAADRAALSRAEAALEPFARLATEEGRAPFKLNSIDPSTTDGLSFDNSSDDAQIPLRVRVGDIRAAHAACLSRAVHNEEKNDGN